MIALLGRNLIRVAEKLDLTPRSAMLTSRYRLVRGIGTLAFALLMLLSVRRTKWLLSRRSVPDTRLTLRPSRAVGDADIELCGRLISAYDKARDRHPASSEDGMWGWIFDARQQELAKTLEGQDPRELAGLMASMFRKGFVLGMAPGPLIAQTSSRLGARAWGLKCLDGLASLAEVIGVTAVESPEQGGAALAFVSGVPALVDAVESELGFRVDFPDVGAAAGLAVEDRLITPDTPDQIYAAVRLDRAMAQHLPSRDRGDAEPHIVEIGGGYGGMCYWFTKCRGSRVRYTIIDLPIVNVIQGYFLGQVLGNDRVSLYGEDLNEVHVVPDCTLDEVTVPFDVLVNKDSMPEMPVKVMTDYLQWAAANCRGLFYSYNQETATEFLGQAQGVVHQVVGDLGGFERVRRDRAWVRDGYVEEVYIPNVRVGGDP